jgi:aspartokinase/homoserine dehydrogenase 1
MVEKSGVAGRFFSALGNAGVSVRAIAQGSSERNISVVIDQAQATKGLRATHSAFFLSDHTLSVALIGPGLIGKAFMRQIAERQKILKKEFKLDVRVRAVANSKKMWLADQQIDMGRWEDEWEKISEPMNFSKFSQHVQSDAIPHSVVIDCTSSDVVVENYVEWLNRGINIITPNKKAGSGPYERFQELRKLEQKTNAHFFFEATVGAGLPIISTLRDLIQTGDEIISIEGIFSGTLSYLFSEFNEKTRFSDIVLQAKQKGFTEPDPRDDLNGLDVARKVVILAREAGFKLNLQNVTIESLVPKELEILPSIDGFMSRLIDMDGLMNARIQKAMQDGVVLRYTGFVNSEGKAMVGLREFPKDHAFAGLKGTDNIIAFRTKRYDRQPLIVRGPGAGPEVTAGGIFADLLRLARTLGARA